MSRIILASQSYSRQRLIALAGIDAEILPSSFDEYAVRIEDFQTKEDYVATIAAGKLLTVVDDLRSNPTHELTETYLIGGDLVVFVDDTPYFKPISFSQAREYIELLAGREHEELCATAFWSPETGVEVKTESVFVSVPELTAVEIENYVAVARPLEKAAGFSIVAVQNILKKRQPPETATVRGSISALLGISLPTVEDFFTQTGLHFPVPAHSIEHTLSHEILTPHTQEKKPTLEK